jgi:hypothetical protein
VSAAEQEARVAGAADELSPDDGFDPVPGQPAVGVGEVVECRFRYSNRWFPAVVTSVALVETFTGVAAAPPPTRLASEVAGSLTLGGAAVAGAAASAQTGARACVAFGVRYLDDGSVDVAVSRRRLRRLGDAQLRSLPVGARVDARCQLPEWALGMYRRALGSAAFGAAPTDDDTSPASTLSMTSPRAACAVGGQSGVRRGGGGAGGGAGSARLPHGDAAPALVLPGTIMAVLTAIGPSAEYSVEFDRLKGQSPTTPAVSQIVPRRQIFALFHPRTVQQGM